GVAAAAGVVGVFCMTALSIFALASDKRETPLAASRTVSGTGYLRHMPSVYAAPACRGVFVQALAAAGGHPLGSKSHELSAPTGQAECGNRRREPAWVRRQ